MKYSPEQIDDLIAKVLAGEATGNELEQLTAWKSESHENKAYFEISEQMFGQIDHFKIENRVDSVKAWEKLNTRIEAEENSTVETKIIPLYKRPVFIRVAASLLLICALAIIVNNLVNTNTVQPAPLILASQQEVVEKDLPDGSKITLNKNSELAYVLTDKKVRQVKLKGEAYFEVTHNEELPFEITIDEVIIKDIGTAFNVKALPESNTIEVLVESGEVYFYSTTNKGLNLVKGEKALYDKTSKQFSKLIPSAGENTASYKSKIFQFKANTLNEVIKQINVVYGSNIVLSDSLLGNCRLSVMFNNKPLDVMVEIISETLDLEIEHSGEKIILKGTPCIE